MNLSEASVRVVRFSPADWLDGWTNREASEWLATYAANTRNTSDEFRQRLMMCAQRLRDKE